TPVAVKVTLDDWRLDKGDTILQGGNRITWFHHNPSLGDPRLADPHLADITFGATIYGQDLVRKDDTTLASARPEKAQVISICAATAMRGHHWLDGLDHLVRTISPSDIAAHYAWWDAFWKRSWIFL